MSQSYEENPYTAAPMTGGAGGWGSYTGTGRDTTRVQKTRNNKRSQALSPFYMNGPSAVPFNHHQTQENLVASQIEQMNTQHGEATRSRWDSLIKKYGHTNSPGTLWALAQSGLDTNADAVQSLLQSDARAFNADYNSALPAKGGSPNAQAGPDSWFDNVWPDDFWAPFQAVSRNAFAALSMPIEALQGVERNIGQAVSDQSMSPGEKAGRVGLTLASIAPPLAAILDGSAIDDNSFQNPWEQTEFGQTLLNASEQGLMAALGKNQAGLDQEAALVELENNPKYADALAAAIADPSKQAQILEEVARDAGLYSSPGWFIDETSIIGEAQRKSTFNSWAIPGPEGSLTAWTLGRGIMSNVGGPDWGGYSFMSGLIDFANSFVDPTIVGAKFGVVSKSMRGIGRGLETVGKIEGAERALTVGKEAKKVRQALGVTNRNSRDMLEEYNRLAGKGWTDDSKITASEWAQMDVEGQVEVVRQMKKMQAAEEARKAVAPRVKEIRDKMRDRRRARSTVDRVARAAPSPGDDAYDTARGAELWDEFLSAAYLQKTTPRPAQQIEPETFNWQRDEFGITSSGDWAVEKAGRKYVLHTPDGGEETFGTLTAAKAAAEEASATAVAAAAEGSTGMVYSLSRVKKWLKNLSPEDRMVWDSVNERFGSLVEEGKFKSDIVGGSADDLAQNAEFADLLKKQAAAARKAPKGKFQKRANEDAARLELSDNAWPAARELSEVDFAGASMMEVPTGPGHYQRAILDGEDVITYWAGEKAPVMASSLDAVPEPVIKDLRDQIMRVLEDEQSLVPEYTPTGKDIVDSLGLSLNEERNIIPAVTELLAQPGLDWQRLLYSLGNYGLDGYLDDVMRTHGFDGIEGVIGKGRKGAWMGDHPMLESYRYPSDAFDNARAAGGALDNMDDVLAAIPGTAARTGLHSLSEARRKKFDRDARVNLDGHRVSSTVDDSRALSQASIHQQTYENAISGIDNAFSDTRNAIYQTLGHEAGLVHGNARSVTLDPKGVRWFLFGNGPMSYFRQKSLTALHTFLPEADVKRLKALDPESAEYADEYRKLAELWIGRLSHVTGNKWDSDTYRAVFNNALDGGGEDGLLNIIAGRVGLDVSKGSVQRGLKVVEGDGGKTTFRTWRTPNNEVKRIIARQMGERPNSRHVNLEQSHDVVDAIIKYGMYAKIPVDDINRYVGKVMLNDGGPATIETNVDVFKGLFTQIGKQLVSNVANDNLVFRGTKGKMRQKEIEDAMVASTRLFSSGEFGVASRHSKYTTSDAPPKVVTEDGREIELPSIAIDSELLHGNLALPSVDEWDAALNRIVRSIDRIETLGSVYDVAKRVFDNVFRTSLLILRGSYIIRNSAEMQIRMFLNGHQSVFNDPMTLMGMVTPAFSKTARQKWDRIYSPYADTVLGTAFEVGKDESAAVVNHVQDYYRLLRESHSLTDPRVYTNAARSGWVTIGADSPHFSKGWANELMMLQRSEIARMVSGEMPPWAQSMAAGYPQQPDAVVAAILSNTEEAAALRARMIAANEDYKAIFSSEQATREYLFDSPNSVAARVEQFTLGDPTLTEYVRTGRFRDEHGVLSPNSLPTLEDRIGALSSRLSMKYLSDDASKAMMRERFDGVKSGVPWNETLKSKKGLGIADMFFNWANTIERLGSVGPEFRMAYWDKIAEISPALRAQDVPRALKSAETTLKPLKKMVGKDEFTDIGTNHPAWEALNKASRENTDGMLKLDELHQIAMEHAAKEVSGMFYDAAKRNNAWSTLRFLIPFGQAWGNTWATWGKLAAQNPVQVYKAQKAFNAALSSGSSALYDVGDALGLYNDYAPGMAPWDQDASGGFLYTNQYGTSTFTMPLAGRAAAIPVGAMAGLGLGGAPALEMESGAESMNVAGDVLPGVSFLGAFALDALPDNDIIDSLAAAARPYGADATPSAVQSAVPAWLAKILAGLGVVPGVGEGMADIVSGLAPQNKNKYVRDAAAVLSATGNYNMSDPLDMDRWKKDASNLSNALLLGTGLLQNASPTAPQAALGMYLTPEDMGQLQETKGAYGLIQMNSLFPMYKAAAGGDESLARIKVVEDFGFPFLAAVTSANKNGSRVPSSEALDWANAHPDEADAYLDEFSLFFKEGDPSDVIAKRWVDRHADKEMEKRTPEEVIDSNISEFMRAELKRTDYLEANGFMTSDQAEEKRVEIKTKYIGTKAGTYYGGLTRTDQIEKAQYALNDVPSLQETEAGQAFKIALAERDAALAVARQRTGRETSGLGGQSVQGVNQMYKERIGALIEQYPDFVLLGNLMLKEWD